jgi:tetratricopeptide (TPR) repeat protein
MSTSGSHGDTDLQSLRTIGLSLLQDGDFDAAQRVFNDMLAISPKSADALAGKGSALLGLGRDEQAVRFLERGTEAEPERADLCSMLGTAALAAGNGEVALRAYTRLQRLGAEPAENYLNLARAAYYALDLERARDYVDLSLAEDPDLEAAKEWEQMLRAIPDHAAFLIDVGRAHCRRARFQAGLALFLESLKQQDSVDGRLYAGRALVALGRPAEAVEHLEAAHRIDGASIEIVTDLASALALAGRPEDAARAYDEALAAEPDNLEALLGKAELLVESGDAAGAGPLVARLVELEPQNPETWFLRARLLAQAGDRFGARLSVERAIVHDTESPIVWLTAGRVMTSIGEAGIASLCRGRAEFAETGKTSAAARDAKASLPNRAAEVAELTGAGLEKESLAEAMRNRATVYANLGEVDRALEYLDLLLKRLPKYETEEVARHRGSLLLRKGDPVAARRAFERALQLDPASERAQLAIDRLDALAV